MSITRLLVGESSDVNAAKDAVKASLDTRFDVLLGQLRKTATANTFLEPAKMDDVLAGFINGTNGGLPSDKE